MELEEIEKVDELEKLRHSNQQNIKEVISKLEQLFNQEKFDLAADQTIKLRYLEKISEEIEVKVSGINASNWGVEDVYLWTWYFDSNDVEVNSNINWNGEWNNSKESMKMTKNQDGSYSFKFKPTELYQDNGIGRIGVLAKAKNGTGDKKTPDQFFEVGKFDLTINSPKNNPYILSRNGSFNISVTGDIELNYTLKNKTETVHTVSNNKNFIKQTSLS